MEQLAHFAEVGILATGKIIWDPGHGGRDPGAISPGGLQEKDLVLDISRRIAKLEAGFQGRVKFYFTRTADKDLSPAGAAFSEAADLTARSTMANQVPKAADREDRIFIALHLNADVNRAGRGLSVWTYPGSQRGAQLGRDLFENLGPQLKPWIGTYGSGLFTADFHVLRETVMPAALIEAGFIGTAAEAEQLNKDVVRQHIAEGAVLGAAEFLGERYVFISDNDQDYEHFELKTASGISAAELEKALTGTAMAGLGQAFVRAEREVGVNAVYLAAHAAWESAWGTSRIAKEKNNLFGYGASDDNPFGNARSFATREEGILWVAQRIRQDYLLPEGQFYHGSNLTGMNVMYATDQNWRHGIAGIMNRIRSFANRYAGGPVAAPAQPAPTQPAPPQPAPAQPAVPALDPNTIRVLIARLQEAIRYLEDALAKAQA